MIASRARIARLMPTVTAVALLLGCARERARGQDALLTGPEHRPTDIGVADERDLEVPGGLFTRLGGPVQPGPVPAGLSGMRPSDCEPCHADIVNEWRSSLHARSWRDPLFQLEYRVERHASCPACHAPLAPAGGEPTGSAAEDGISCAVCHVRDGQVLGRGDGPSARPGTRSRAPADHPIATRPSMATSAFCAPCHQFRFPETPDTVGDPGAMAYAPELWLQDTYREWRRSRAADAGKQCQDCHMPRVDTGDGPGHRSHRFGGMRDPALLARAVHVQVDAYRLGGDVVVQVHLRGADIGHALPTGDMFRQLVFDVWGAGHRERGAQATFTRSFAPERRQRASGDVYYVQGQRADSRVPAPSSGRPVGIARTLRLRDIDADEVQWQLVLHARAPGSVLLRGVPEADARAMVRSGRILLAADR